MSETPTGTDRVELTDDEWDQLAEAAENETLGEVAPPRGGELELTVESIVAARVQAQSNRCQNCSHRSDEHTNKWGCGPDVGPACPCTAYREPVPPGDRLTDAHSEKQNALNNRCQRVEKANETLRAELAAANARCAELEVLARNQTGLKDHFRAKSDALQATLDRVTATFKRYEDQGYAVVRFYGDDQCASTAIWAVLREAGIDLRAALTPEGKP